jgi:hypothetical protein
MSGTCWCARTKDLVLRGKTTAKRNAKPKHAGKPEIQWFVHWVICCVSYSCPTQLTTGIAFLQNNRSTGPSSSHNMP